MIIIIRVINQKNRDFFFDFEKSQFFHVFYPKNRTCLADKKGAARCARDPWVGKNVLWGATGNLAKS